MSDIGPQEVIDAVEDIHNTDSDEESLEKEKALLEETPKGDDHVPEEPLA